jgi:hypothetical protein
VYDVLSMEKDKYPGCFNAESDTGIYIDTVDDLCTLVREVYLACPDEPFINQYGNHESWNLYLVSDLVLENLGDDSKQSIFHNLLIVADEREIEFEPYERVGSIKTIVSQLITESVVNILRKEEIINIADQKRIILAETSD